MTLTRRPRAPTSVPRATASPTQPSPLSEEEQLSQLKDRSLLTLRGLSDLGTAAMLHELTMRMLLTTGPAAVSVSAAGADSQLLLGGLIGVWTAAVFAERLRAHTADLIQQSTDIPNRWDAAFVHRPAIESDDALDAVAWLYALDELEGPDAAQLLRNLAEADSQSVRLALAAALAEFPVRSNAASSALGLLADDADVAVRNAAVAALGIYERSGVLGASSGDMQSLEDRTPLSAEENMAVMLDRIFEEPLPSPSTTGSSQDSLRWIFDAVARRVEYMGSIALQPDVLSTCAALPMADPCDVATREVKPLKARVPLFEGLGWSEVHGLCALALLPVGYELLSVLNKGNLPMRFVGLGWLLAVGGLAVYPRSGALWRRLRNTLEEDGTK